MTKNTNVYPKFLDDECVIAIYQMLSTVVIEGSLSSWQENGLPQIQIGFKYCMFAVRMK